MKTPSSLIGPFFTGEILQKINISTNIYAELQRASDAKSKKFNVQSHARSWNDTNTAEIKVFFAILIYMGVHYSRRTGNYWRNDLEKGPIHMPQYYMNQTRF